MTRNPSFKIKPVTAAVASALLVSAAGSALAQDDQMEEIVVRGIRGSLTNSMNIKRDSTGVVDAISAEDIGKFPDTNLAESMQRITGVSIDRLNGEGNQITVRGFGPGFNLVTLNGRTIPTTEVPLIGAKDGYVGAAGRSFDFSNLASEGVSALEVVKTGNALLPSGGLGSTVNIQTVRPLTTGGTQGTFSVKANADTSVSQGDSITPEATGLYSWVNDDNNFGVSVFGSYSKRDSGAASGYINDYAYGYGPGISSSFLRADGSTVLTNPPADGQLWMIPQDSRNDFSDITRERLNGQLTVQFKPNDDLTLTADYLYVDNNTKELRYEQTNWYATPMDQITFDTSGPVVIPTFMQENNNGTKDVGFEQQYRQQDDTLDSFGVNLEWQINDSSSLRFDAHTDTGKSQPDNPLGHSTTATAIAAPVVAQHSTDYSKDLPVQYYTYDDSIAGNDNGVLDTGDLASQVWRSWSNWQDMDVDEFDLRYTLQGDSGRLDVGVNSRSTSIYLRSRSTQQDLGSWGMAYPQDVDQYAPGVVEAFCMACEFDTYAAGDTRTAFRADATKLFSIMTPIYENLGNAVSVNDAENWLDEDIMSVYAQFQTDAQFMGKDLQINAGLRYEQTDVKAKALQPVPTAVLWTADNDFLVQYGGQQEAVNGKGSYSHLLPNIDFRLNVTDDVVARLSYSQTIGRVPYDNLRAITTVQPPNRPTVLGGVTGGNQENPGLLPLESENFDLSVEWYYGDASYVSLGFFDKKVKNFLGTGVFDKPLFGLLDPTAGNAGSRSGDALAIIDSLGIDESEANLFTLVALIDANGGDRAAAQAEFESHLDANGVLPQSYVDQILGMYDVTGDSADPEMIFRVTQPVNSREGHIHGWEVAWQHFFGDTGFGIATNYTIVDGDVNADNAGDPTENQFALVGLSDTANFTAIYEKFGWSARVAYNWRDAFLNATNQGGARSPQYTDAHGQIDASVTYDLNDHIQLSFEGINLNGEPVRMYRRKEAATIWAYELEPRYSIGARYRF
jgi:TonB-dependent receptor